MFLKIHRKGLVLETLFDKEILIKNAMQHKYFPVNFCEIYRSNFLTSGLLFRDTQQKKAPAKK